MSLQTAEYHYDDEVLVRFVDYAGRQPNSVYTRLMFQLIEDCCSGDGMHWWPDTWCYCRDEDECELPHHGFHEPYDGRSSP